MTQATDTDIQDIKTSIEANTRAIGDLSSSVSSLREEIRIGFANVTTQITRLDGRIDNLETKLDSKIDNLEIKIDGKLDTINNRLLEIDKTIEKQDDRLIEINKTIDKQDNRLWLFGGLILSAALGTIYKLLAFPSN
jgi:chromosome segregation ATPase